ncbi:MAG: tetratricopeptide repeat protein [Cyclobacteriaceae bacterium]|nr:tetratricopeptide repeat protein [Cyclobacteriaceae bacterium]MCK5277922.1 tetratricopeptide repeat protein [Cyclobacteriaceae bacterium]MCK5471285.1 tetratricopeptide repeat protein [Cyclobacteriaceae bacterium]MCK5702737.1 tetratricopeptide repeat protein [Cyclobacteriaceae bacterium]
MAKSKKKGKQSKGEELLENPEVLAEQISKTEEFIEKNKKLVFSIGGALSIIVAAYFLYNYWITNQNEAAQSEMFQAVYYFEADSLDNALNGDGNNYGFLDIIEEYAMTDAANLANYYTGAIYLKKGEYISAVDYLDKFSSNDLLIQARAYALIGDANMEMGNFEEAVSYYNKAADYNPNEYTSPMYLIKAAIAYEILEDYKSAFDCYNTIVEKYVNSSEYQTARKHKARLEGKANAG